MRPQQLRRKHYNLAQALLQRRMDKRFTICTIGKAGIQVRRMANDGDLQSSPASVPE